VQGKEALHMPRLRIDSGSGTFSRVLSVGPVFDSFFWKSFSCDPSGGILVNFSCFQLPGGSSSFVLFHVNRYGFPVTPFGSADCAVSPSHQKQKSPLQ
jgi:hypothetical protein